MESSDFTEFAKVIVLILILSMKSTTEYLTFNIGTRRAFINITPSIRKIVEKSEIKEVK
jgi:hypothetical protein